MDESYAAAPEPRRRSLQITDRDRELVGFVAEHRFVLAAHVQRLLGISAPAAETRLRALCSAGLLSRERVFHRQPSCYRATRRGLTLSGSTLRPRKPDLSTYRHDVGLAWLWLAARSGTFGEMREVISERQLRSRDASAESGTDPLGVRLGGFGSRGRERVHYPDLILHTADGHRVAVELELTRKGRVRRETILAGYAADARIDAVLYLVDDAAVARDVRSSARRLGAAALVHVQPAQLAGSEPSGAQAATRVRAVAAGRTGTTPADGLGVEAGR